MAIANHKGSIALQGIAHKSKKDGAALKLLTILGMLFFPGTFIAVSSNHEAPSNYLVSITMNLCNRF